MDYKLEIEYKVKKNNKSETKEIEIEVDIEDYIESYSEDQFHLSQSYDDETVEENLHPVKEEYCENILNKIKKDLPKKSVLITSANDIMNELDEAVAEYEDEMSVESDEDEE